MDPQGRFLEASRREMKKRALLDRWRDIEDEETVQSPSEADDAEFRRRKEDWFSDAFTFLIQLPREIHIWCAYQDVMWPLLEPFCNYFENDQDDLPLKLLWKRVSKELERCTQCIVQHHKAQELYKSEFEDDIVRPLLIVLQTLDEARVAEHLKDINARAREKKLDAEKDYSEVVSVLFEVLMFPCLLDDRDVAKEFVPFIIDVEKSHDLTLAGNQQYPGVYALLFIENEVVRSIGFRLAGFLGKLRNAAELESIQPLLKKCIHFLDDMHSNKGTSRPRIQYGRDAVWLGIKSLIGFLEPPAFEEGIVECYPIFLSIVLNHVSDDSTSDFMHAVNCLKLLFEILGCKLWLRTTFSPSVMRNTLLGQCFHSRAERHHKAIFDLFQPFLQSLEALQDGEYEKQRRHFLYFLLHQVRHSSNFSVLMKKKACQIAISIVGRSYRMDPPCPPFECAHMWGPSLIHSVMDSSLHSSLRQPAFELIQTIIVADAAALISLWARQCNCHLSHVKPLCNIDEDDDELQSVHEIEEVEANCWTEFNMLSKLTAQGCKEWFCIPLLWVEVLSGMAPLALPLSFSKSVIWTLSRFSVIEPEKCNSANMPVLQWISENFKKTAVCLKWDTPKGCDDGADGGSRNSIKAADQCKELLRIMRRCAANYAGKIEGSELCKQWTWEPRMAETIILLLLDPDDLVRQVDRIILEQVSNARGLVGGLQFLCSSQASLSAMSSGLCFAIKLLRADSLPSTSRILHHFFFIVSKLLTLDESSTKEACSEKRESLPSSLYSSGGGFLQSPLYSVAAAPVMLEDLSNERNEKAWKRFCELLSENIWPLLLKCLREGKHRIHEKGYQMTYVRVLEILPLIFGHMNFLKFKQLFLCAVSGDSIVISETVDSKWFYDLIEWGRSQITVVQRRWKQAVAGILKLFKDLTHGSSLKAINAMETILASDTLVLDELQKQASLLCISMSGESGSMFQRQTEMKNFVHSGILVTRGGSLVDKSHKTAGVGLQEQDNIIELHKDRNENEIIVLSDDEVEKETGSSCAASKSDAYQKPLHVDQKLTPEDERSHEPLSNEQSYRNNRKSPTSVTSSSISSTIDRLFSPMESGSKSVINEPQIVSDAYTYRTTVPQSDTASVGQSSVAEDSLLAIPSIPAEKRASSMQNPEQQPKDQISDSGSLCGADDTESGALAGKSQHIKNHAINSCAQKAAIVYKSSKDLVLKDLVSDTKDDPLEVALDAAKVIESLSTKAVLPKRQLIHLQVPVEHQKNNFERLHSGMTKYKPPRLDDWYKPILELDYFSEVGISFCEKEPENLQVVHLTEVPTSFHSPDHYMEIFRPLVLEEFKAQLRHTFEEVSSPDEMCCGSLHVLSVEKVDDFQLVRFRSEAGEDAASRGLCENDLVLLSRQPFQVVSQNIHMVGKVERRERDTKSGSTILVLRLYLHSGNIRLAKARRLLIERSKWCATRLMSITPHLREFQALSAVKDIPLLPIILNPYKAATEFSCINSQDRAIDLKRLPDQLQKQLKLDFNESQLRAIGSVLERSDSRTNCQLSLIQGPPGTGKTRTIVAIVSALLAVRRISNNCSVGVGRDNLSSRKTVTACLPPKKQAVTQSVAVARAWQDAALARQLIKESINSEPKLSAVEEPKRGRVLICAQSNAAVDELVSRIYKNGLYDMNGERYKPYIVRVGNAKTVHPDSLPVFIDTLVEQRLGEQKQNEANSRDDRAHNLSATLRTKLEKMVETIRMYEANRSRRQDERSKNKYSIEENGNCQEADEILKSEAALTAKLNILYKQKRGICTELAVAEAEEKKTFEDNRAIKHDLRRAIIREAEVVVTTLSGCGGDIYSACIEYVSRNRNGKAIGDSLFDAVVIDEAAQALEPATLIPLQLLKSTNARCVMVGDPKQLPATVLSQLASKFSYECSMFERLQRTDYPVTMLNIQYRMHAEICQFPSAHFYDNQLKDGGLREGSRSAPFHESLYLGPYVFFDVVDGQEESGRSIRSQSLCNESEVDVALEILRFLKLRHPKEFQPGRIGIITPYKQQLAELRVRFAREFGPSIVGDMEFNTVDGFQGREVDILIFSTVRASSETVASKSDGIGFVSDVRRMNVALTRAKFSLWIVGSARTLQRSPHWAALLKNVKERNLLFPVKRPYKSMFCNMVSDSSTKNCLANDSNVNQILAKHLSTRNKIPHGQQDDDSFKRNLSKRHSCQMENEQRQTGQIKETMKERSRSARNMRNIRKKAHGNLSVSQENNRLHPEVKVKNGEGRKDMSCDDAKDDTGRLAEKQVDIKMPREKAQAPPSHSAKRKAEDRSDLMVNSAVHQIKSTANKSEVVGKNARSSIDNDVVCRHGTLEVSRSMVKVTDKGKHLTGKHKDCANAGTEVEACGSNVSHLEAREKNKVVTPKGNSLQRHTENAQIQKETEVSASVDVNCPNSAKNSLGQHISRNTQGDLISARKRQRDAVDAILPVGALISCKKPEYSRAPPQARPGIMPIVSRDVRERVPISRQVSPISVEEKSASQMIPESLIPCHGKERAESSSQQNTSNRKERLSEEWQRFEKKLAESKNILQSARGSPTGPSNLSSNQ